VIDVDLSPMADAVRERYGQVIDDATQAMLLDMEENAPRDTGAMTQTITIDENDSDALLVRTLHAPQEYSSWQDEGTGYIYPVNAKVLHFIAKDGTEVFAKFTRGVPSTGWWSEPTARFGDFLEAAMR
jgi:hypothetical protein